MPIYTSRFKTGERLRAWNRNGSSQLDCAKKEGPPLENCVGWFSAEDVTKDDSNYVSAAADLSGNAHHLAQTTASKQAVWAADQINGLPAIHFYSNRNLRVAFTLDVTALTYVCVLKCVSHPGGNASFMDGYSGYNALIEKTTLNNLAIQCGSGVADNNTKRAGVFDIVVGGGDTTDTFIQVNDYTASSGSAFFSDTESLGGHTIGSYSDGLYGMDFWCPEWMVYTEKLAGDKLVAIRNYLQSKYAITF